MRNPNFSPGAIGKEHRRQMAQRGGAIDFEIRDEMPPALGRADRCSAGDKNPLHRRHREFRIPECDRADRGDILDRTDLIGAEAAVPAVVAVGSYSVILMAEDAYRERLEGRRFGPFDKAQNFLPD